MEEMCREAVKCSLISSIPGVCPGGCGTSWKGTSSFSQPIVGINELHPERLRPLLISKAQQKRVADEQQLTLDFEE